MRLESQTNTLNRGPSNRRFRSIKAWQRADDLAVLVYQETKGFPSEELYGLTSQMRRAAISTAANIVEGCSRRSRPEYLQFLSIAKASLEELSYYIHLSRRLGYFSESQFNDLNGRCEEAARTLYGLIEAVSREAGQPTSRVSGLVSRV